MTKSETVKDKAVKWGIGDSTADQRVCENEENSAQGRDNSAQALAVRARSEIGLLYLSIRLSERIVRSPFTPTISQFLSQTASFCHFILLLHCHALNHLCIQAHGHGEQGDISNNFTRTYHCVCRTLRHPLNLYLLSDLQLFFKL